MTESCPNPEDLSTYLDGELPADVRDRTAAHLASCGACATLYADLAALQMVYTASDLIGNTDLVIRFSQDGGLPPEVFRHQTDGVGRQGLEPMPLLWITAPRNGLEMSPGQIQVVGTVKPGATAPVVTVTRDNVEDTVIADGFHAREDVFQASR